MIPSPRLVNKTTCIGCLIWPVNREPPKAGRMDPLVVNRPVRVSRRDLEKVMFSDLADGILADYKKNQRKSAVRLGNSLAHLRAAFSG